MRTVITYSLRPAAPQGVRSRSIWASDNARVRIEVWDAQRGPVKLRPGDLGPRGGAGYR
jgi:hypothetical protein